MPYGGEVNVETLNLPEEDCVVMMLEPETEEVNPFGDPEDVEMGLNGLTDCVDIEQMDESQLVQEFFYYKDMAKLFSEKSDEAKEIMAKIEGRIVDVYTDKGAVSGSYVDRRTGKRRTVYIQEDLNPVSSFSYLDEQASKEFFKYLSESQMEHLTVRTSGEAFKSFRSIAKEEIKNNDGEIPDHMKPFVKVLRTFKVNLRSR
jgi:hypothetical protein